MADSLTEPLLLTLPWPPSLNNYWRTPRSGPLAGRTMISKEGRIYRSIVLTLLASELIPVAGTPLTGRLSLTMLVFPPNRVRRDLDNMPKAVLDALTHARIYEDDSQIDELVIRRCSIVQEGGVRVEIRKLTEPGSITT